MLMHASRAKALGPTRAHATCVLRFRGDASSVNSKLHRGGLVTEVMAKLEHAEVEAPALSGWRNCQRVSWKYLVAI